MNTKSENQNEALQQGQSAPTPPVDRSPVPSIGRIVHYTLTDADAKSIEQRRQSMREKGYHMGNDAHEGQVYPAMVVAAWGTTPDSCVNLQVILDGYDTFWATSRSRGEGPGTWSWPPRN